MSERDWQEDWEMCQCATSGKWEIVSANCPEGPYMIRMPYPKGGTWYGVRMIAWKEDAEFIAEAREALPYWLQRVRELEAENVRLRGAAEYLLAFKETLEARLRGESGIKVYKRFGLEPPTECECDPLLQRAFDSALIALEGGNKDA